ncbi:MAG: porphobilinogen synthase [Nitrospinae bacterium]|nr:porphobilinogen synthase [Nitrospinota bacterium]
MPIPIRRPRRLREDERFRRMVRETRLSVDDLIYPLFTVSGESIREEIPSMPGVYHLSADQLVLEAKEVRELGIPAVILFGVPEHKDPKGSEAYRDDGVVQRAVAALKAHVEDLVVITDVCLCAYTDHGHCGIVVDGRIDNDATLEPLVATALSHVRAGADMVAPSDMMDGRVLAIRTRLDEEGFEGAPILSYAVKYASAFYGPFRDASHSAPAFGDRKSHQMDPPNSDEAIREAALDIEEGADIVMVKPALPYLDVIRRVKDELNVPVAAYNVSGEYAMVKAAAARGWLEEDRVVLEVLTSIRRAGADMILTYHAKDAARYLRDLI